MLTSGGEIGAIYKAYDAELKNVTFTDEIGVNGSAATSGGSNKWMYGKPYAASNNFIYLMPDSLCADIAKRTFSDCKMVAHKRRSPNYYVFDTDALDSGVKTYLTPVTRSDLNDYLKTGVGADTVLALSCPAEYSAVIIFR